MSWVPFAIGGWLLVSLAAALVIGLSIRQADRRARETVAREVPDVAVGQPAPPVAGPEVPTPRLHRHPSPPTDDTRASRLPVVHDCLPAAERRPTSRPSTRGADRR